MATRRSFLAWLGGLGGALSTGLLARCRRSPAAAARVAFPVLAPGPLEPGVAETLAVAAETLLEQPIERQHYRELFEWRAAAVPGCRGLYQGFAAALDAGARDAGLGSFAASAAAARRRLLAPYAERGADAGKEVERGIFRDVRALFARTDALALLGYEAWPGTPRGLDAYVRPPRAG